jgi:pimeloyl-ACP methyl ester carboxylesterase
VNDLSSEVPMVRRLILKDWYLHRWPIAGYLAGAALSLALLAARYEQPYPTEPQRFTLRDGATLHAAVLEAPSDVAVVLVHGVLASSLPLNRPSGLLREALAAEVVAVDLRGHGTSDGVRTLFFNLPPELPLRAYSYRAMVGGHPADHRRALAAIDVPLLAVVGSADEAFRADRFAEALGPRPGSDLVIVPGATHDGVLVDPRTYEAIRRWGAPAP